MSLSAVAREAAWLADPGYNLPALLKANGGPFDVVQAYWPRTPPTRQTALYLTRTSFTEQRFSNQRKIQQHEFKASLWWPIGSSTTSTGIWETEQAAFDAAVDLVLARIRGTLLDHTHGGRFLSAAEAPQPGRILIRFGDPAQAATAQMSALTADITYACDDSDFTA